MYCGSSADRIQITYIISPRKSMQILGQKSIFSDIHFPSLNPRPSFPIKKLLKKQMATTICNLSTSLWTTNGNSHPWNLLPFVHQEIGKRKKKKLLLKKKKITGKSSALLCHLSSLVKKLWLIFAIFFLPFFYRPFHFRNKGQGKDE